MFARKSVIASIALFTWASSLHAAPVKLGIDVLAEKDFAPLQGKRVAVITNQTGAYITNGRVSQRDNSRIARSDAQGRFSFPPETGAFALIVLILIVRPRGIAGDARE